MLFKIFKLLADGIKLLLWFFEPLLWLALFVMSGIIRCFLMFVSYNILTKYFDYVFRGFNYVIGVQSIDWLIYLIPAIILFGLMLVEDDIDNMDRFFYYVLLPAMVYAPVAIGVFYLNTRIMWFSFRLLLIFLWTPFIIYVIRRMTRPETRRWSLRSIIDLFSDL